MPRVTEGHLIGTGKRFALVVSRFNSFLGEKLLEGALDSLTRHGVKDGDIDVVRCPGSFEIPLVAKKIAENKKVHAVICLGVIIRGETPHFDYVAGEAAKGISHGMMCTGVPMLFGIVTADTLEQAIHRCGAKEGNKGAQAAEAAIEMANLLEKLEK